jgi:hypothetical protein
MTREKAVDLVMNAQQSVCRRAGCWCYSRTRCWNSGGKGAEACGKLRVRVPGVARPRGGGPVIPVAADSVTPLHPRSA